MHCRLFGARIGRFQCQSRATKVPLDNVVPLGHFATLCKKKNTSGELRRWPKLPIKIFVSRQILVGEKKCWIRPTPFTSAYHRNEPSYRHVSLGSSSYCRAKLLPRSSLARISKSNARRAEILWIFRGFNCWNVERQKAAAWNSSCPVDRHLPQIPSYLVHLSFRDTRRNIYFPPVAYIGLCTQSACLRMVHT